MNERFHQHRLPLAGLTLVERKPIADQRGYLERLFCADTFAELGLTKPLVQINHTLTRTRGTVRGMHFQHPPHAHEAHYLKDALNNPIPLMIRPFDRLRTHHEPNQQATVRPELVEGFVQSIPNPGYLKLDCVKARGRLGWRPQWHLDRALESIVAWHRAFQRSENMNAVCLRQIDDYAGGAAT